MRTRSFLSLALVLWLSPVHATSIRDIRYYPQDFLTQLSNGLRENPLRQALFEILSSGHIQSGAHDRLTKNCPTGDSSCHQHWSLGYTQARRILFGDIHLQQTATGYAVFDVYCESLHYDRDFRRDPPGPGQIPDNDVLNTEHTWPQSHFTKKFDRELQKSDLHILYPVLSNANSSRGNLDFSEVVSETTSPCAKSKRGYSADGTGEQFFEPPAKHKGNVARALFYFSVRYQMRIPAQEEASLKAWNRMDPPDDFERLRNDKIDAAQGNRNPFIDEPGLADLISDF